MRGVRPREIMSSVNDDSLEKFFSTRAATKVPAPWRRVSRPSLTRPSSALRTVMLRDAQLLGHVAFGRQGVVGAEHVDLAIASRSALCSWLVERRVVLAVQPPMRSEKRQSRRSRAIRASR